MSRAGFSIVLVGSLWEVRLGGRRDLDLTVAVRQAIGEKSPETQRKAARFLSKFMNHSVRQHEVPDAFITESVMLGRIRIEEFLSSLGFEVVYETNRIDGSCRVRRPDGSVSSLPVGLAALSRLYAALHRAGLRPSANPAKVDGWHKLSPLERIELAEAVMGTNAEFRGYRGSQYVASGIAPSPLRIEDPVGLGPALLAAGLAYGWPRAIYDLVTVMADDGPRWADTSPITAADWARSSAFGRTLWAPNKASKGARVKEIVVTVETVAQLRRSFDDDPARPSMRDLKALLAARAWDELERIFLFPSRRGVPHTYGVFNNDYIRPAAEAAGLTIRSAVSSVRPTVHRLRAARIQSEVDYIFREGRTEDEIEADLRQLQQDVHIRSRSAFYRYVGEKRQQRALQIRVARFDEHRRRAAAMRAAGVNPPTRRPTQLSRAEERLIALG